MLRDGFVHIRGESLKQRLATWAASCERLDSALQSQGDSGSREGLLKRLQALESSKPTAGLLEEPVLSEILSLFTAPELQRVVALARRRLNGAKK
jgi:hypothetical protein